MADAPTTKRRATRKSPVVESTEQLRVLVLPVSLESLTAFDTPTQHTEDDIGAPEPFVHGQEGTALSSVSNADDATAAANGQHAQVLPSADRGMPRIYALRRKPTVGGAVGDDAVNMAQDRLAMQSAMICCFWCSHTFDGPGVGMPERYDAGTDTFYTSAATYCSLACAAAHNFASANTTATWDHNDLLNALGRRITKNPLFCVTPAPPRESLRIFGGPLTVSEFRRASNSSGVVVQMLQAPIVPMGAWVDIHGTIDESAEAGAAGTLAPAAANQQPQATFAQLLQQQQKQHSAGGRVAAVAVAPRKGQTQLRLNRTKPLSAGGTLTAFMT